MFENTVVKLLLNGLSTFLHVMDDDTYYHLYRKKNKIINT